jgi:hypothetical protein
MKPFRRVAHSLAARRALGGVSDWVGGPTADQQARMQFFDGLVDEIRERLAAIAGI